MRALVDALCSPTCAGRAAGSPGGIAARAVVEGALRDAGLDPRSQPVPSCGGANVLARVDGDVARWILVGAHYDHLGARGRDVYWGADDNAAAVAILVDVARALAARPPAGRGVIVAAFDAEEPPWFLSGGMGSQAFLRAPPVPRAAIDFMVCMDLVGHRVGGASAPDAVGASLFALGAERSVGTAARVDALATREAGLVVRRADADVIPPLSDYEPFWRAGVPFLFLTCARSRVYHTPDDTPDKLDFGKMAATARWLERFVRDACARPDAIAFDAAGRDDAATLRSVADLAGALAEVRAEARMARAYAEALLARCDARGALSGADRGALAQLVAGIEGALSGV